MRLSGVLSTNASAFSPAVDSVSKPPNFAVRATDDSSTYLIVHLEIDSTRHARLMRRHAYLPCCTRRREKRSAQDRAARTGGAKMSESGETAAS